MIFKVKVTADKLHMRQGAGSTFDSISILNKGDLLDVISIDNSGTWLEVRQTAKGGKLGWCSAKYLQPQTENPSAWLALAVKEIGTKEFPGNDLNHPRIQAYLSTVNGLSKIDKSQDETPWCSCFMNWCVEQVSLNGTDSAWAKSWGNWRNVVKLAQADIGDIAVFDRSTTTVNAGHVAIFITKDDTAGKVLVLGGNQSNAVRYSWYPLDEIKNGTHHKLLSCRRI